MKFKIKLKLSALVGDRKSNKKQRMKTLGKNAIYSSRDIPVCIFISFIKIISYSRITRRNIHGATHAFYL